MKFSYVLGLGKGRLCKVKDYFLTYVISLIISISIRLFALLSCFVLLRFIIYCPQFCKRELNGILCFSQGISRRVAVSGCGLLLCCCRLGARIA